MRLQRPIGTAIREGLTTAEKWHGEDYGLIACWERGREIAAERPELAERALRGELVVLPWRGGVERQLRSGRKYGSLRYLAMWQGLRGEDLDVRRDIEREVTCTRFGVTVSFTADQSKFDEVVDDG